MKARGMLGALLLFVLVVMASAADFPMPGFNFQRMGATTERAAPPLALVWRFATSEDRGFNSAPVVAGERVFFCAHGVVYCLDITTGQVAWEFNTGFDIRMTPLWFDGRLYVGNDDGDLFVLDTADTPAGDRLIGVVGFGEPIRSAPVILGTELWIASDRGKLFRAELTDLEKFEILPLRSPPKGNLAWDGDNYLYITGRDNLVHCIDIRRERIFWAQNAGTMVTPVVVHDGQPVVATRNGLVSLKPTSGRPDWVVRGFSAGRGTPAVVGDEIYVAGRDENLYVIDAAAHKIKAAVEMDSPVESSITVADDSIYMGTGVGNIYCIDRETLEFKWYYRCGAVDTIGPERDQFALDVAPSVANGAVFAATAQGSLFCFRPDEFDVGKPRLHLPQIVTTAVDGSLVVFEMLDDELRQLMREDAEEAAPEGTEATIPKQAEMVKVPGKQATFRFETYVYDEGSGVQLDKIMVKWNGQPHRSDMMTVTPNDFLLTIDLMEVSATGRLTPLRNGEHVIEITVPDFKGNTVTRTFTFQIDNDLPPIQPQTQQQQPGGLPGPGGIGSGGLPGPGGIPGPEGGPGIN